MFQNAVDLILLLVLAYLLAGLIFAVLFAFKLVDDFDEEAKGAPVIFRLLIVPASALLWIYLLKKIRRKRKV
ncbi:MAG TPA: hypothetical protein VE978_14825 [Chitinophagales bacterium]|nr:hypothetical protein [Chitinophagales bacterium]